MERNRLTLVAPEDAVAVPSDDATNPAPVTTTQDSGAPTLHHVRVDKGSLPDDAA
jgi:hypothetical protein